MAQLQSLVISITTQVSHLFLPKAEGLALAPERLFFFASVELQSRFPLGPNLYTSSLRSGLSLALLRPAGEMMLLGRTVARGSDWR